MKKKERAFVEQSLKEGGYSINENEKKVYFTPSFMASTTRLTDERTVFEIIKSSFKGYKHIVVELPTEKNDDSADSEKVNTTKTGNRKPPRPSSDDLIATAEKEGNTELCNFIKKCKAHEDGLKYNDAFEAFIKAFPDHAPKNRKSAK